MLRAALLVWLATQPALACETALLLSIDVSASIDAKDYRVQTDGLAAALIDPQVAEALVRGQVALAMMQWSGTEEQALVLPWRRMLSDRDVLSFAAQARTIPRAFSDSDTAVGESLRFAIAQFAAVPDCARHVIDISGDGRENAGSSDEIARGEAMEAGITVNAIAIDDPEPALAITFYYRRRIITPDGFVVTAQGMQNYAQTLQLKLLRELLKPVS